MNLSLCPVVKDGWSFDFEEDLELTPTPRDNVDWSQLPNDIIKIILEFYYHSSQIDYWSQITEQRNKHIPQIIRTYEEKRMIEYHLNKRKTIGMISRMNDFSVIAGVENPSVQFTKNILNHYYEPHKIKIIKNKKKTVKSERNKKKQRCSVCGKLGHNKNNRKYH